MQRRSVRHEKTMKIGSRLVCLLKTGLRRPLPGNLLLKQAQLLAISLGLGEIVYGELRTPFVQPEFFAGDLEPSPYHPGDRTGPLHARAPLRVVIAAATHIADQ